jgi:hypothetical protein
MWSQFESMHIRHELFRTLLLLSKHLCRESLLLSIEYDINYSCADNLACAAAIAVVRPASGILDNSAS